MRDFRTFQNAMQAKRNRRGKGTDGTWRYGFRYLSDGRHYSQSGGKTISQNTDGGLHE